MQFLFIFSFWLSYHIFCNINESEIFVKVVYKINRLLSKFKRALHKMNFHMLLQCGSHSSACTLPLLKVCILTQNTLYIYCVCIVVKKKKKGTLLLISAQIIVGNWNLYQSTGIIVYFDAFKFSLRGRLRGRGGDLYEINAFFIHTTNIYKKKNFLVKNSH